MCLPDPCISQFIAALEGSDHEGLRQAPRAESQFHERCGGDWGWLAARTGCDVAPVEGSIASMDAIHASTVANIGDLFSGREGRRLGWEGAFIRAERDSVTQIALAVDSNDPSAFARAFRRITVRTPKLFRSDARSP